MQQPLPLLDAVHLKIQYGQSPSRAHTLHIALTPLEASGQYPRAAAAAAELLIPPPRTRDHDHGCLFCLSGRETKKGVFVLMIFNENDRDGVTVKVGSVICVQGRDPPICGLMNSAFDC